MVETIDEAMPEQDQGPLYTKESRDTMTPEKLNDLYKEAVKPSQAKYNFTSMTLTDEKRIDDLYNMNIMIAKTKQQHRLYDMADVFTIVFPTVAGGKTLETTEITNDMGEVVRVPKMVDLYAQYDESNSTNSTDKSKDTSHADLNASKIETVCWNCGQLGHAFTTCPKPRNEQRIANAKSQYMENKRTKKATKQANVGVTPTNQTNKWRPPTANEDNKRVIDGKHMFYFHKTKRWMLDKRHPSNQPSTHPQSDTTNLTTTASSGHVSDHGHRPSPDLEAALANTTRAIESSLRGLVNQFTNT